MRRSGVLIGGVVALAIGGLLWVVLSSDPTPPVPDRPLARTGEDRSPRPDRAPDTVPIAREPAPTAPRTDGALPETRLPLVLLGTVFANVDAAAPPVALAVIEDPGAQIRQVVRTGDVLRSFDRVVVAGIEERRVILLRDEQREALRLPSGRDRPMPISEDDLVALLETSIPRIDGTAPTRHDPEPSPEESLARELEVLAHDDGSMRSGPALLDQGRFSPRFNEGHDQILGMQIDDIEPGGFYDRLGLMNGDVITVVNGIEIQTISDANEMLLEFSQAGELEIELGNSAQPIRVTADQLDELMNR